MSRKRPHRKPKRVAAQFRRLRERDGDGCWWCGLLIDFTITSSTDPVRASRDHVVPVIMGGTDDDENMRLAHARCNEERDLGVPGSAASAGPGPLPDYRLPCYAGRMTNIQEA